VLLSSFILLPGLAISAPGAHDEGRICASSDARGVHAYTRPRAVSRQPPALLHHVPSSRSSTYTCSLLSFSFFLSLLSYQKPTDRPTDRPTDLIQSTHPPTSQFVWPTGPIATLSRLKLIKQCFAFVDVVVNVVVAYAELIIGIIGKFYISLFFT